MAVTNKLRNIWYGLKQRCNNPNFKQWNDYGGRGIKVRFKSFDEFFAAIGERPPGMVIDRIDNDGDYARGNVRWTTRAVSMANRRNAVFVKIKGKKYRAMDLAKKSGIKTDTVVERAERGLSLAKVLSPEKIYNLSGLALGGEASGAKKRALAHCCNGHEYTPENTLVTKEGWRRCRACHRLKMQRRYAAARK